MANELIKSLIGKVCDIKVGSFGGGYYKARIIEVVDNWIRVEFKGTTEIVNIDYITSIQIAADKLQKE